MKSLFGAFSRKKKRSVDEDEAQADDNFEEMQEEQEAVETGDMIEAAVNSDRSSAQIREGLQNIMDDSNTHPIQYGGLDLCGLADSILRKLSPLDELTENEIYAIRAKIEHPETVAAVGKRQKKKSLVMLGRSIIDYIDQKCWCTSFHSKRYQRKK